MKRYEGLFILNTAGHEDSIQALVDSLGTDITEVGGKVETIQKMDKRHFARVARKKYQDGFYVNVIFEGPAEINARLQERYRHEAHIFRLLVTDAPLVAAEAAA
ncbi:MAG: 30S ribosomal protein S6 [Verrucomicrobiae bacterium]|jgi:small subunit ribosomal protein S6|nr:30S ribosomal protein S6 [Verrucomicrobiae bacterium]